MSSTVYWQQVTPDKPLGSHQGLKWILWEEGERPGYGEKVIIRQDSATAVYLKGYLNGLPEAHASRENLAQFLLDLRKYHELEVWISE
jgi:hypothetical protein